MVFNETKEGLDLIKSSKQGSHGKAKKGKNSAINNVHCT